ncbi:MAG: MMPL family transporter [Chitinispirillaceae bacterium]
MFSRLVFFLNRHRRALGIVLAVISGLSIFVIVSRPISSNILDLLPLKDRVIGKQYYILSLFRAVDRIVIDISGKEQSSSFAQLSAAGQEVTTAIEKSGFFDVQTNASAEQFIFLRNLLVNKWSHLFTSQDSAWLSLRLDRDTLSQRLTRRLSAMYMLGSVTVDPFLLKHDPFGLAERSLYRLSAFKPTEDLYIEDGLITDSSRSRILLFAATRENGLDDSQAKTVTAFFDSLSHEFERRGFDFTWMGAVRASRDNAGTIQRDVHLTAPLSFLLILLICTAVYRRWYYGLFAFLPTALGVLFALGIFSAVGGLSLIILGFGAALLGITIDYAIHYICHTDVPSADRHPVDSLAPAILASALTTAGAFAVLIAAGIPGLAQLGMVTAVGILLVAFLSLSILPVVFSPSPEDRNKLPIFTPSRYFKTFYDSPISFYAAFAVIVFAVLLSSQLPKLSFDGRPDSLNGMSDRTRKAEQLIEDKWAGLSDGTYLAVEAKSFEKILAKTRSRVDPLINKLKDQKLIQKATSITGVIPPHEIQHQNHQRWLRFWDSEKMSTMEAVIDSLSKSFGVSAKGFNTYLSRLKSEEHKPIGWNDFPQQVRSNLLANYIRCDSSGTFFSVTPIFPTNSTAWEKISEKSKIDSVLAVNDATLGLRVVHIIKGGFVRSAIYIPLVVAFVLLLIFRNYKAAALAMFSAVCATLITLGSMAVMGIPVTIISLMIFAFIFGLGIDYTVLMIHMGRKTHGCVTDRLSEAAGSISIAAATTLAGLGTLAFAKHPVLAMVGKTGIIGIVSSYLCAIVLVPIFIGRSGLRNKGVR